MTRRKVTLDWIEKDYARKASFKKRSSGLVKKVKELSTLCGVDAFVIISGPDEPQPLLWPRSQDRVRQMIERYENVPSLDRQKKLVDQVSYLKERTEKCEEKVKRLNMKNRECAMSQLMSDLENGVKNYDMLDMAEIRGLVGYFDDKLSDLENMLRGFHQMSLTDAVVPANLPPQAPSHPATHHGFLAINCDGAGGSSSSVSGGAGASGAGGSFSGFGYGAGAGAGVAGGSSSGVGGGGRSDETEMLDIWFRDMISNRGKGVAGCSSTSVRGENGALPTNNTFVGGGDSIVGNHPLGTKPYGYFNFAGNVSKHENIQQQRNGNFGGGVSHNGNNIERGTEIGNIGLGLGLDQPPQGIEAEGDDSSIAAADGSPSDDSFDSDDFGLSFDDDEQDWPDHNDFSP